MMEQDREAYTPAEIHRFILGGALLGAGAGWAACALFVGDRLAGLVSFVMLAAFLIYREHWAHRS